ncbi:MAG: hypothetical protein DRP84_12695 [Spirochaetes bacterium]|nr:MAG: hypothetical protein DRP84_12695 [Spirochaetota bacterium]
MKRKVSFQYNGKLYTVNVERIGNEIIIEHNGEVYKINLIQEDQTQEKKETISVRSDLSTSLTPSESAVAYSSETDNNSILLAPMTGIINEIKIKIGSKVKRGDTVIVLEAMKMYIDIHAHKSGIVKEIFVTPGENISINQKLLRIE